MPLPEMINYTLWGPSPLGPQVTNPDRGELTPRSKDQSGLLSVALSRSRANKEWERSQANERRNRYRKSDILICTHSTSNKDRDRKSYRTLCAQCVSNQDRRKISNIYNIPCPPPPNNRMGDRQSKRAEKHEQHMVLNRLLNAVSFLSTFALPDLLPTHVLGRRINQVCPWSGPGQPGPMA